MSNHAHSAVKPRMSKLSLQFTCCTMINVVLTICMHWTSFVSYHAGSSQDFREWYLTQQRIVCVVMHAYIMLNSSESPRFKNPVGGNIMALIMMFYVVCTPGCTVYVRVSDTPRDELIPESTKASICVLRSLALDTVLVCDLKAEVKQAVNTVTKPWLVCRISVLNRG